MISDLKKIKNKTLLVLFQIFNVCFVASHALADVIRDLPWKDFPSGQMIEEKGIAKMLFLKHFVEPYVDHFFILLYLLLFIVAIKFSKNKKNKEIRFSFYLLILLFISLKIVSCRTMSDVETFAGKNDRFNNFSYNVYEYYKCRALNGIALSRFIYGEAEFNTIECHLPEQQSYKVPIPNIKFNESHYLKSQDNYYHIFFTGGYDITDKFECFLTIISPDEQKITRILIAEKDGVVIPQKKRMIWKDDGSIKLNLDQIGTYKYIVECGDKRVEKSVTVHDLLPPQLDLQYDLKLKDNVLIINPKLTNISADFIYIDRFNAEIIIEDLEKTYKDYKPYKYLWFDNESKKYDDIKKGDRTLYGGKLIKPGEILNFTKEIMLDDKLLNELKSKSKEVIIKTNIHEESVSEDSVYYKIGSMSFIKEEKKSVNF